MRGKRCIQKQNLFARKSCCFTMTRIQTFGNRAAGGKLKFQATVTCKYSRERVTAQVKATQLDFTGTLTNYDTPFGSADSLVESQWREFVVLREKSMRSIAWKTFWLWTGYSNLFTSTKGERFIAGALKLRLKRNYVLSQDYSTNLQILVLQKTNTDLWRKMNA